MTQEEKNKLIFEQLENLNNLQEQHVKLNLNDFFHLEILIDDYAEQMSKLTGQTKEEIKERISEKYEARKLLNNVEDINPDIP